MKLSQQYVPTTSTGDPDSQCWKRKGIKINQSCFKLINSLANLNSTKFSSFQGDSGRTKYSVNPILVSDQMGHPVAVLLSRVVTA